MKSIKILLSLALILILGLSITLAADPKELELTPGGEKSTLIPIMSIISAEQADLSIGYLLDKELDQNMPKYKKNKPWTVTIIRKSEIQQPIKDPNIVTPYLNIEKEKVWAEAINFTYNPKAQTLVLNNITFYNDKGQIIADAAKAFSILSDSDRTMDLKQDENLQAVAKIISLHLDSRLK